MPLARWSHFCLVTSIAIILAINRELLTRKEVSIRFIRLLLIKSVEKLPKVLDC